MSDVDLGLTRAERDEMKRLLQESRELAAENERLIPMARIGQRYRELLVGELIQAASDARSGWGDDTLRSMAASLDPIHIKELILDFQRQAGPAYAQPVDVVYNSRFYAGYK